MLHHSLGQPWQQTLERKKRLMQLAVFELWCQITLDVDFTCFRFDKKCSYLPPRTSVRHSGFHMKHFTFTGPRDTRSQNLHISTSPACKRCGLPIETCSRFGSNRDEGHEVLDAWEQLQCQGTILGSVNFHYGFGCFFFLWCTLCEKKFGRVETWNLG